MTQLRDQFMTLEGMRPRVPRPSDGDGELCQAAGCPSRATVMHAARGVWLCGFHTEMFT